MSDAGSAAGAGSPAASAPPEGQLQEPAAAGPDEPRSPRLRPTDLRGTLKLIGELVGLVSGIAALVFLVRPELEPKPAPPPQPPAKTEAQLARIAFEPRVRRLQYLAMVDQPPTGFTEEQLQQVGVFLRYRVTIRGFERIPLKLKSELFDADRGREIRETSAITITPPKDAIARDWHDWVQLPKRSGQFFIVIKLLASGETAPLATLQSPRFNGATGAR